MVLNKKGGNKSKKLSNKRVQEQANRDFITKKEEGQVYARIVKYQGGSPPIVDLMCSDGKERVGVVCKKLKRMRMFCNKDDIVLVNLRDYQDKRCDVIWVYDEYGVKRLEKEKEITTVLSGVRTTGETKISNDDFDSVFAFGQPEWKKELKDKDKKEETKDTTKDPESSSEEETDSEEEEDGKLDISGI